MTNTPEMTKIAIAHGKYIRGSASKVRRVLNQIRGKSYRDALIMLEFMPYRSTDPITKVLRSAVANAEHNLGMDPSTLVISSAWANSCLLYTSDAADDLLCVDLGGRRIIKKRTFYS